MALRVSTCALSRLQTNSTLERFLFLRRSGVKSRRRIPQLTRRRSPNTRTDGDLVSEIAGPRVHRTTRLRHLHVIVSFLERGVDSFDIMRSDGVVAAEEVVLDPHHFRQTADGHNLAFERKSGLAHDDWDQRILCPRWKMAESEFSAVRVVWTGQVNR